jgi:hypothetical protein
MKRKEYTEEKKGAKERFNRAIWALSEYRIVSEYRLYSEFVSFVNEYHQIVSKDFAKRFIDHRNIRLGAERVIELALNHAECGFDIGAFVIVGKKIIAAELKVMEHMRPQTVTFAHRIVLVDDIRRDAHTRQEVHVGFAGYPPPPRSYGIIGLRVDIQR